MNDVNPYKSPANHSGSADVLTDFRSRAVAVSEMMRRSLSNGLSSENNGVSSCVLRQPSLSHLRAPIKVTVVVSAVLAFLALFGIASIKIFLKGNLPADKSNVQDIAFCCVVGAMLLMFLPTYFERRIVRHHLSQHAEESSSGSHPEGIHVALENALTSGSMKILAEDVGLVYIHPEAHYLEISGLCYDYVIQSRDVINLSLHSNGKSVLLSYMIGNERLDFVIIPRGLLAELKRQTLGSSRSLFSQIQNALEPRKGMGASD